MTITLILEWTCPCGTTIEGASVRSVRVNKCSMRTLGTGIGFMPRACRDCGQPVPDTAQVRHRIADGSLANVNAYRVRKGWPLLAAAEMSDR